MYAGTIAEFTDRQETLYQLSMSLSSEADCADNNPVFVAGNICFYSSPQNLKLAKHLEKRFCERKKTLETPFETHSVTKTLVGHQLP